MTDPLSVDNLIEELRMNQVDDETRRLCQEAERLSRQRDFIQAIWLAQNATGVATQLHDLVAADAAARARSHTTTGIAFLYLAVTRHLSPVSAERDRALRDCETAIRWLKLDRHHRAIAEMIRARLLIDNGKPRMALRHYQQASQLLDDLRIEWHRRDDAGQERYYARLRRAVAAAIERVEFTAPPAEPTRPPESAAAGEQPTTAEPQPATADTHPLFVRTFEWQRIPVFSVPVQAGLPDGGFDHNVEEHVEIEISRFLIEGKPYALRRITEKGASGSTLRLRKDRRYVAVAVDGNSMLPTLRPSEYVLAREQKQHEFDGQLVVVKLGIAHESSPVKNVIKRARGYPKIQLLESANHEHPSIKPTDPEVEDPVIGVVDAILTLVDQGRASE